ncbi:hypothetical protein EYV94_16530 [Puteibacter caeruleilacunae]|nr:hypothetical protein EYV94_16530 [Puteibacter caeruleilacunae]
MENFFDTNRILQIIWKWKWHFVAVGAIAFVLAAIITMPFIMRPKFKSTARLYPINVETLSKESESEQLLEILNSMDIKLEMFKAFKLAEYYEIDPDDPHKLTYLINDYEENVNIKKTEFETIEIKVLDWDPGRAKDMVDSLIVMLNRKVGMLDRAMYSDIARVTATELKRTNKVIDSVVEQMTQIRKDYGILDYEMQVKELSRAYGDALAAGKTGGAKNIKKVLDNFAEEGGRFKLLEERLEGMQSNADSIQAYHNKAKVMATRQISYSHVVQKPFVADKKAWPIRWLIALMSVFSSLFLALIVILIIENQRN